MTRSPRCSVIIPTFNRADLLPYAIASVRTQGVDDIEILIIDDSSTDGTREWLSKEAARDPRIIPLRTERRGPSFASNLALSQARAPIVAFLEADDLWWPGKLAPALAFHEANPAVAFSFTDYLHVDTDGQERGTCFEYWRASYVDKRARGFKLLPEPEIKLLAVNVVGTSTVVASRSALHRANGFSTASRSAHDWRLWLRLAAECLVAYTPETTTSYRIRPIAAPENMTSRIDAMRNIIEPYAVRRERRVRRALRQASARIDIAEAELARHLGDHWNAALAHSRALVTWPDMRTARAAVADFRKVLGRDPDGNATMAPPDLKDEELSPGVLSLGRWFHDSISPAP